MSNITFDTTGILVDQRPALIQAGTLHYFRLPHSGLWRPVLQRMRAAGFNAVTLPIPWGYHSPAPGFYDFTGPRDLARLLDEVAEAGLWLIVEAGPWVGAGLDAGGVPSWLLRVPDAWPRMRPDGGVRDDEVQVLPLHFLRYVWEWWSRLAEFFRGCESLVVWMTDAGPCVPSFASAYREAFAEMVRRLGLAVPMLSVIRADHPVEAQRPAWMRLGEGWREGAFPIAEVDDVKRFVETTTEMLDLRTGPQGGWASGSRRRMALALGEAHPFALIASVLGRGTTAYTLTPFHSGCAWGYWRAPDLGGEVGIGSPLEEGAALAARYFNARCAAMTAEVLGEVLIRARARDSSTAFSVTQLYASDPNYLYAVRSDGTTSVTILRSLNLAAGETRLSLPIGADTDPPAAGAKRPPPMLTSEPVSLPGDAACILPVNWPIQGGFLRMTNLPVVLRIAVAGRAMLVLLNEAGGDVLFSDDFRVRHARGPVRTQRTAEGLAVRFEKARVASLLLTGLDGPVQLLALAPQLARRVWPLDDTWRTTPAYKAAWEPGSEDPARGLVIGPELVLPQADGSFDYMVGDRGAGYRWGPWRGSDPNTWLSPLIWRTPRRVRLPELSAWESRPAAPELLPAYDDHAWRRVPSGSPLAMEAFELYQGFIWYRGYFDGEARAVTLTFRHACDLFLNGVHLAALDALPDADDDGQDLTPRTVPLPPKVLADAASRNVLVVLVESLGRAQNPDLARSPHGLIACHVEGGGPVRWRVRGGLSGERRVQGFPGYADWDLVPQDGAPHITWHRTTFLLALPDDVEVHLFLVLEEVPARALIFLNGRLIGDHWESRGPRRRFWLPEGVLRRRGENEVLIAQWTRGMVPGWGTVRLEAGPVYQWYHEAAARG